MRQIRLRYSQSDLEGSDFSKFQFPIVKKAELKQRFGSEFESNRITFLVEFTLQEGKDIKDIDEIPWFSVIEHQSTEISSEGTVHRVLVENWHDLVQLGHSVGGAIIAPGSFVSEEGAEVIVTGTKDGCKKFIQGFQSWLPGAAVSINCRDGHLKSLVKEHLSEENLEAFRCAWAMGYYNEPRSCTIEDIGKEMNVSRLTASKYLRAVNNVIAENFWNELSEDLAF